MKFQYKDIELEVPDTVYYPEEDSLLLLETVEKSDLKRKIFLEVGCGSGLISIVMAKKGCDVTATDIDKNAVLATKKNAERNGVRVIVKQSDLLSSVKEKFDLIVFNPPYLPEDENDSHLGDVKVQLIGGATGREVIERFLKQANSCLNESGKILLLISSLTGEKEITKMCKKYGYGASAIKRKKIPWEELMVLELVQSVLPYKKVKL